MVFVKLATASLIARYKIESCYRSFQFYIWVFFY